MKWRMMLVVAVVTGAFFLVPKGAMAVNPICSPKGFAGPGIDTALGCVPVKMDDFVKWLLPYLFGIAGGISFLLMVYGFILMATSEGDPKKIQAAQETITSALQGLLTSIFALFILRLIILDILKIPGL